MRVILDSNAIIDHDWLLQGPYAQVLIEAASRRDLEILIPDVVRSEVVATHERRTAEALATLKQARSRLESLLGSDAPKLEEPEAHRFPLAFWRRLGKVNVRRLPIPNTPHREIVDRAIERRPPFDKEGKAGYRDVLIWQNVIDEASSNDTIVFVTNDGDFADIQARRLRPELERELLDLDLDPHRVRIAVSLKEAAKEVVEPATKVLEDLKRRLAEDDDWARFIHKSLEEVADENASLVSDSGVDVGMEADAEPFADGIEEERLDYVDNLRDVTVEGALPVGEDRFLVEFRARADAFYDVGVSTSALFERPDLEVPAGALWSADDRTITVGGAADVVLVFNALYDSGAGTITRPDLERLAPDIDERAAHTQELLSRRTERALGEFGVRRPGGSRA